MNLPKMLSFCAVLAFLTASAMGATNFVAAETSFQAAIDAASAGDTLLVEPGAFNDAEVVFNKPLTVIASGGALGGSVNFLGNVRVEAAGGTTYFQQATFMGTFRATQSPVLVVDGAFYGTVTATGGKLTAKRTRIHSTLTLTNTAFEGLRVTFTAAINALCNTPEKGSFVMVQSSTPPGYANSISNYKVWLAYNYSAPLYQIYLVNCDTTMIGNSFRESFSATGGTLKAYNNLATCNAGQSWVCSLRALLSAELENNTFIIPGGAWGIALESGAGPVSLVGNIFSGNGVNGAGSITANNAETGRFVSARYCSIWATTPPVNVAPPIASIFGDPKLNADFTLAADSPCRNAGRPEAVYNDLDGTRNSIGHMGGNRADPAKINLSDPMVFLLTGPQTFLRGAATTIPIRIGAASGH